MRWVSSSPTCRVARGAAVWVRMAVGVVGGVGPRRHDYARLVVCGDDSGGVVPKRSGLGVGVHESLVARHRSAPNPDEFEMGSAS